jgi:hypothetical protein
VTFSQEATAETEIENFRFSLRSLLIFSCCFKPDLFGVHMAPLLAVKMDRIIPVYHSLKISPFQSSNIPLFPLTRPGSL